MPEINPYLQATANFAHQTAKEGEEAVINGTFDKFIDRLAKFMAYEATVSGKEYMDYDLFNTLTIDEFQMMCLSYGLWDVDITPTARDWFITTYKKHHHKFTGFETNDAECL